MFKSLALLSLCASSALGFVAPGTKTAHQSTSAGFVSSSGAVSRSTSQLEAHKLVLIRHGESEWNDLNIFTGWADAALNEKGLREAAQGGQLLKDAGRQGWHWPPSSIVCVSSNNTHQHHNSIQGFTFDLCYTSVLKRAIKTLWIVLEEMDLMYLPIVSLVMSLRCRCCLEDRCCSIHIRCRIFETLSKEKRLASE